MLVRFATLNLPACEYVLIHLRASDAAEAWAVHVHGNPLRLARELVYSTDLAWYCTCPEGRPAAVLALTSDGGPSLQASVFATDEWPRVVLGMTRFIRQRIGPMLLGPAFNAFDRVQADSIAGHTEAHRWMAAIGARPEGRETINGHEFIRFVWSR